MKSDRRVVRIAHAFGNNRKLVKRALAADIDMIEADIWHRGGQVYVHHERRLNPLPILVDKRMPGHRPGLFAIALPGNYYVRPDVNALTLGELIRMVQGTKKLLLDVKGQAKGAKEFAKAIVNIIREQRAQSMVEVCGQVYPVLRRLQDLAPDLIVRYSVKRQPQWENVSDLVERGEVRRICIQHRFIDKEKARFLKERDVDLYCWTVDELEEARRLAAQGIDGIISNDLGLLERLP
jgi:glycerophosphoryl diester phosphodiesterase